jgi:hypothetical protein
VIDTFLGFRCRSEKAFGDGSNSFTSVALRGPLLVSGSEFSKALDGDGIILVIDGWRNLGAFSEQHSADCWALQWKFQL